MPVLEPGLEPLEGPVVMTGPCLPRLGGCERDDPALHALHEKALRIYVSLGTVFNGQPRVFELILDGVALGEGQVVVSAGASFERLAPRAGPDVHIFRRVPQVPLLSLVDLVITHGGNNTVQECLSAGRPMVVIPFGGDQIANARRVERLGAGVALMPSDLTAARVREAIDAVCRASIVERAKGLGASLSGLDGTGTAAAAILALVAARRAGTGASAPQSPVPEPTGAY
jgi:MGT family glycosyltransferase